MKCLIALFGLVAPAAALAADNVTLASHAFVERVKPGPNGKPVTVLEEPRLVTPGDKLVFELSYRNQGAQPATGFVITDPIPSAVTFAGSVSPGAVYSVDGGRTWGPLAALRVATADGKGRPATAADVTHVRWNFPAIPAGAGGKVSFRGIVR
ncbi:MAG: hypothetical protein QOJ94_2212 [Sphingomonadales bacterium]|jgi:uncharacterized repeat protein (TIGR01451 family)|nr:hypothetical protein [Sphingomonadales bacterium]